MTTRIYSVTVNAFDRTSTTRIHAVDEQEAREKALERVHFLVKVEEVVLDEHGIPIGK